ncbi:mite group 2 allergen Pso o 2-like [Panulirus ornatus]|uniref:mite group 2 allergen Pso o 2-like n=1 Tax=Panulirus ornatus TaxID=150431 RepID=UPI003A8BAB2E
MRRLLLTLCLATAAYATTFQDCGSVGSGVALTVEGCQTSPCQLHLGQSANVSIQFTASQASRSLTVHVTADIYGVEVPWPGLDTDACHHTTCPYADGDHVDWAMTVEVSKHYPLISTKATFKLVDGGGQSQVCALVDVRLVPALPSFYLHHHDNIQ